MWNEKILKITSVVCPMRFQNNVALLRRIRCYLPMFARRTFYFHLHKLFLTIVRLFQGLDVI